MKNLLLLLAAILPQPSLTVRDDCLIIERNFFHGDDGRLVFEQFIFWGDDLHVRDWRLAKDTTVRRDFTHKDYVLIFQDGEKLREVRAPIYRETFTMFDVELTDREFVPLDRRRKLCK